jgi:PPOX class probable F420-dependent enzyme
MRLPDGGSRYGVAWVYGRRRARLATVGADGFPHCVPVIYGFDPKRRGLYFMAAAGSRKVRNIAATGLAAVSVDDESAMRGVSLAGPAAILAGPDRDGIHAWLVERRVVSAGRRLDEQAVIRVEPARWAEWGLDPAAASGSAPSAEAPAGQPVTPA